MRLVINLNQGPRALITIVMNTCPPSCETKITSPSTGSDQIRKCEGGERDRVTL